MRNRSSYAPVYVFSMSLVKSSYNSLDSHDSLSLALSLARIWYAFDEINAVKQKLIFKSERNHQINSISKYANNVWNKYRIKYLKRGMPLRYGQNVH